jgi:uncharacterized membrane protein YfcA
MMEGNMLIVAVFIALAGGVIRGITGFGGALVMTPPLSYFLGPQLAVPAVLVLESFAAMPMLPAAVRIARFRLIIPICIAAAVGVPLGVALLVNAEPRILRRWIAGIVIVFSLMLLNGLRYRGSQRQTTSVALGAFSGVLLGATSIGMPPIILYLLSGPDSIAVTRANLTLCIVAISIVALVLLWTRGVLDLVAARTALILAPCFYIGVKAGIALFAKFDERRFRQFTLMLLVAISTVLLFL